MEPARSPTSPTRAVQLMHHILQNPLTITRGDQAGAKDGLPDSRALQEMLCHQQQDLKLQRKALAELQGVIELQRIRLDEVGSTMQELLNLQREGTAMRSATPLPMEHLDTGEQLERRQELLSRVHQLCDHTRSLDEQVAELRAWKAEVELQRGGDQKPEVKPEFRDVQLEELQKMQTVEEPEGSMGTLATARGITAATLHTDSPKSTHSVYTTLEEYSPTYEWEESVYDCMLLAFLHGLSSEASLLIILGFLVHVSMVALTCFIVAGEEFKDDPFEKEDDYLNWRFWDAHSYLRAEFTTEMTLGTRVCAKDRGLSFAGSQTALFSEMVKYNEGSQGVLLCNVAVMLWICCCAGELRRTINFALVLGNLPAGAHTNVRVYNDGTMEFLALACWRQMLGFFVATVRGIFALLLVYYGSAWLSCTTSIEDLLLNASALGFVLDIDNTIFSLIGPQKAIALFHGILQPGVLPRRSYVRAIPYGMLLCMIGATLFVNIHFISPMNEQMKKVQADLCEPRDSMRYALGVNPLGWITYTNKTHSYSELGSVLKQYPQYQIIKEMVFDPTSYTPYALRIDTLSEMQTVATSTLEAYVDTFSCNDYNTLHNSDATVGTRLFAITGDTSLKKFTTCEEIKSHCTLADVRLLITVRVMCPSTCGCSSPTAVLWNTARTEFGCPQRSCKGRLLRTLNKDSYTCEDYSLQSLKSTGWAYMVSRMRINGDVKPDVEHNLTNLGCAAFKYLPDWQVLDLCTMNDLSTFHGAATLCPVSCQCKDGIKLGTKENCPNLCPKSCCK